MDRYISILSDISSVLRKKRIDQVKYQNFLIEYPVPDIIDFDWKKLLSDPPANTSSKTNKELLYLSDITANRVAKETDLVYNIDAYPEYYILQILKKHALKDQYNGTIKEFYKIIRPIIWNIKYQFNRPRPYQLADIFDIKINTIHTLTHHTPSYPSGHTVYASLYSKVLSHYYPEYSDLFDNAVKKTMLGRELQGVHYPSDNKASLVLVEKLFERLKKKVLI